MARTGRLTAYTGAVLQLVGLGWDAVLHRLDPELAAREGVFTLTNPGHLLFAGGLALVVVGLGLMLLTAGRAGRSVRLAGAGVLGALAVGTLVLAANSEGGLSGHPHDAAEFHAHEDGAVRTHDEHEQFVQAQATSARPAPGQAAAHDHGVAGFGSFGDVEQSRHQQQPDIAVQFADLAAVQQQVAAARAGTEQYQDIRVALRDGFIQMTQDLPGIAAHFVHPLRVLDSVFDPAKPEVLLYAKTDGAWSLVGLSYLLPHTGSETAPEGFAGPLDVWHYHTNLCFAGASVISAQKSAAECRQARGRFVSNTGWMTHLWLYTESPEGLFAHQNSRLTGSGAVLTRAELAAMQ